MKKIILLGDTITQKLPENLIATPIDEVKNFSSKNICCETFYLNYWPKIKKNETDIYILLMGINDIMLSYSNPSYTLDNIVENLKKIITDILSVDSILLVQSIYPTNNFELNKKISYVNEKVSEYCYELDIEFLDFYELLTDKNGLLNENYSNDGIHPNIEGFNLIANQINDYIDTYTRKK